MEYVRFAILGVATGSLYALVALAVVVTYRSSGVLNFSAGAVGAAGAYVFYDLRDTHHVYWVVALVLGVLTGAALGVVTQLVVMRLLRRASDLVKLIATLGIMSLVQGLIVKIWGTVELGLPISVLPSSPSDLVHVFGDERLILSKERLIIIAFVAVLTLILRFVYSKTLFGLATTAVSENPRVVAAGGWSVMWVQMVNFSLAGALSATAAILLAPIVGLNQATLTLMILPALAAALLGRFSSFALTVLGAVVIGVLQSEIQRFVTIPQLSGLSDAVPLVLIVAVTMISGRGRLGRGDRARPLPLPGTGRVHVPLLIGASVIGAVLVATANPAWADALTTTFLVGILVLSVVVVTGYCGQLSLGQFALAGFGAWVAARLVGAGPHLPVELGILVGVALTVPVGLLVALPALRTRGVDLAITTLGLALLIQALIFNNSELTGGYTGTVVDNVKLFGWDIDAVAHPQRYGLVVLGLFVCSGLGVANLRRSKAGRRLLAVRSDERAAAALGVGVRGAKLYAFAVGAALAALSGIFIGFRNHNVLFTQFNVFGSITAVQYAVVGGIGWAGGALIGASLAPGALLAQATSAVINLDQWILLVGGASVIYVLAVAPDGLAALYSRLLAPVSRRFFRPTVLPRSVSPSERQTRREPLELELQDLTVRFGGVTALERVSLVIRPGQVLGVIGPNGAGKTTLLDVVTGFTRASEGSVRMDGRAIDRWSPERRARAGLSRSFQGVELFEEMTVRENLLVAVDQQARSEYLLGLVRPGRPLGTQRMNDVIAEFRLEETLEQRPSFLSHGAARLVGIARAVVAEPSVLFLDEPAAGLDFEERREVGKVVRRLADQLGIAVVVVEHDVPLVMGICDRVAVLDFGRKIAEGTPAEIQSDPLVIGAYLGGEGPTESVPVENAVER